MLVTYAVVAVWSVAMKRDLELIHEILRHVEEHEQGKPIRVTIAGRQQIEVERHIALCAEAGFIERIKNSGPSAVRRLTWHGHEALDKLRAGGGMSEVAECSP